MSANLLSEISKFRQKINKKIALGLLAIFMCIGLIVVCSFVPFIIDPSRWQTTEFLTDELIICAIVIMSMVSLVFIGQASNAQHPESRVSKARVAFFKTLDEVNKRNVNYFRQWIRKVLQVEDIAIIKENKIRALGIEDPLILLLDNSQLLELYEQGSRKFPVEGAPNENDRKGRYFKRITKDQYKGILKLKENEINVKFVEPEYYLSVKSLVDTRTISERASNEGKKKGFYLSINIVSKLIITVVSAMIFASLVRDLSAEMDMAAAWAKFVSRLWAMITSAFMGYLVGCQMNDIDAEYIEMRTQVHTRYLQDTKFKPMSQQEEAREEYIKEMKKDQVLGLENKSHQIEYNG